MAFDRLLRRFRFDPLLAAMVSTVVLASVLPARGVAARLLDPATILVIALLFFLYGARLSSSAVLAGLMHWRLQLTVFCSTFVLFPILGLVVFVLTRPLLGTPLAMGLLYLSTLPSTVQTSIAFTSTARGNVAAAICSASLSNILGVVVTPLLVAVLFSVHGTFSAGAIGNIAMQLIAPFVVGQMLRPWIGAWIEAHKGLTGLVDRGSILLIVYAAFSESTVAGLWHQIDLTSLVLLLAVNLLFLALVLIATTVLSRALGFSKPDEIAIVFCGSKKSMATGVAMAKILFVGQTVGVLVLPVMLFHQIQLMACAALAQHYAKRPPDPDAMLGRAVS